ncbi:MAG TPA: dienelactone hydrolase family protein [Saprospiraceae bacterium]|nr:dienelactone hydrolase family protein [Saprospiraceae bacterium]
MIRSILLYALVVLLLPACSDSPSGAENQEGMAKFASDSNFQNAHEQPAKLDFQGKGEIVKFPTSDGKEGSAYVLRSEQNPANVLFVFHEWWGLNDYVKREAERLFGQLDNTMVIAPDLYDGQIADNPDAAGKLMQSVTEARAKAIIEGAFGLGGDNASVATVGWCFGGGWSLKAAIMAGDKSKACVMYYGMPVEKAAELAPLKTDVLGIFAKKDNWINEQVVGNFEKLAKATGKKVDVHWYDADHAFANPSSPRYNEAAATEANTLALNYLKEKLK